MQHIENCLRKFERLRHRQNWWYRKESDPQKSETDICVSPYERVRSKDLLLVCPDGDVLKQNKEDSLMWRDLLFTDPLWSKGI